MVIIEPRHEISNNVVYATSKGSDQPAHTHSLIRAFAGCLNILWLLSYWQTSFGVSKLQRWLHRLVWVYTCQNTTLLQLKLFWPLSCWMFYVLHSSPIFIPLTCKHVFSIKSGKLCDPDQMDQDLQYFQQRINPGPAGQGLKSFYVIETFSFNPRNVQTWLKIVDWGIKYQLKQTT